MAHPTPVLKSLGLDTYIKAFEDNEIHDVTVLDKEDIKDLIPKIGPRSLLWSAIKQLRGQAQWDDDDDSHSDLNTREASLVSDHRLDATLHAPQPLRRSLSSFSVHDGLFSTRRSIGSYTQKTLLTPLRPEHPRRSGVGEFEESLCQSEYGDVLKLGRGRFMVAIDRQGGRAVTTVEGSLRKHWKDVCDVAGSERENEDRENLFRELRVLRGMRHRNLLEHLAVIDDSECTHVVYPFPASSIPFSQLLQLQHTIASTPTPGRWIQDVSLGVQALHQHGIIHKRLSIDCLIVNGEGRVQVLYLAVDRCITDTPLRDRIHLRYSKIAAAAERGHWCTECNAPAHGMSPGMTRTLVAYFKDDNHIPPGYRPPPPDYCAFVAPEILRGESATEACDVWSIGVLYYVILFGRAPPIPVTWFTQGMPRDFTAAGSFVESPPCHPQASSIIQSTIIPDPSSRLTLSNLLNHPQLGDGVSDSVDYSLFTLSPEEQLVTTLQEPASAARILQDLRGGEEDADGTGGLPASSSSSPTQQPHGRYQEQDFPDHNSVDHNSVESEQTQIPVITSPRVMSMKAAASTRRSLCLQSPNSEERPPSNHTNCSSATSPDLPPAVPQSCNGE